MKNKLSVFSTSLLLTTLIACGGAKPILISSNDINQAQSNGTLIGLYDKAESLIKESRGSTKKELVEIQKNIAQKIVVKRTALVEATLNLKTEYELVPLEKLEQASVKLADLERVNVSSFGQLAPKIGTAQKATREAISEADTMSQRTAKDVIERFKWLKKAAILSGLGSDKYKGYEVDLSKTVEQLTNQGRESYAKRMFNMSLSSAQKGLAIDPGNLQFESMLSQSQAALFEQDFRAALENGKPELAYQSLKKISDKPIMLQIKKKMERPILLLANYFASNAQASYQKNQLYKAYTEFKRGRDVQTILAQTTTGFIQEKQFLDKLMSKYNQTTTNEGIKLGLLKR